MKKFRVVALDTSTKNSGVALFDNAELKGYKLIDCSKIKDVEERIDSMGLGLLEYLEEAQPDAIYIEHPQGHGRNVAMVGKLCEILGIVRGYALSHSCDYEELTPSVWRKYAGFNQGKKDRKALKQMSIDYVREHFGISVGDDVADAISIGCSVINFYKQLEGGNK